MSNIDFDFEKYKVWQTTFTFKTQKDWILGQNILWWFQILLRLILAPLFSCVGMLMVLYITWIIGDALTWLIVSFEQSSQGYIVL
jgi:hypothetical protein